MKLLLVSLLICFQLVRGQIEWPFEINDDQLLIFDINAGTPNQAFQIGTFHLGFYHPLRVPDASTPIGIFDPTKSSTWSKIGDSKDRNSTKNGVVGTDTFTIGGSLVIPKSQPFEVINKNWEFPARGTFTLSRSDDNTTAFTEALLDQQKQKVIVLAYDYWTDSSAAANLTGFLTIGAKPTKKCVSTWTMFNETVYEDRTYEQWAINLAGLSVGKYSFSDPGQISFQINDPGLGLPASTYDIVLKALGSTDNATIPCDVQTKITFTLDQNFDVNLSPADFVVTQSDGSCTLRANRLSNNERGFIFPIYVLRNYCLLLDYKNIQIGLAARKFS